MLKFAILFCFQWFFYVPEWSEFMWEIRMRINVRFLQDEIHKSSYSTLPGTQYFFNNCICNCRMQYLLSTCNCTVDFIYPSGDNQQCKISDLRCLFNNNGKNYLWIFLFDIHSSAYFTDLFNHEKPLPGNQYFSDKEDGMVCDCLPVVLFYFRIIGFYSRCLHVIIFRNVKLLIMRSM